MTSDPSVACLALMTGTPFTAARGEALPDRGCRFTGVRFGFGQRFGYEAASLEEHGFTSGKLVLPDHPAHIRVEWHDVAIAIQSGNPVMDWVNRQQQVPFDVVFDVRLDTGNGEATLSELSLSGASLGRTMLSGSAHFPHGEPPMNAAVEKLTLHLDSKRLIPVFLLSFLAPMLPPEDPAAAVATYQTQAETMLRDLLPQAGASPATVEALVRFVQDFPHPTKVLDLHITAAPPVGAAGAAAGAQDLPTLLKTLSVTATYDGEAR